jgi:hypothetical protein
MTSVKLCLIVSLAMITSATAQYTRPLSLPDLVLDCYHSFVTITPFPESPYWRDKDNWRDDLFVAAGDDNAGAPMLRYRLQVVDQAVLKVIEHPNLPAFRKEHEVRIEDMMQDFYNKHSIVGWRESNEKGGLFLYVLNFDDLLFSVLEVTTAKLANPASGVDLTVMKCKKVSDPG